MNVVNTPHQIPEQAFGCSSTSKLSLSIFGLGYVGAVSTACFAKVGHKVIGVDTDPDKVKLINRGETPIVEDGLEIALSRGVQDRLISATTYAEKAVLETDISFVCVGTPSAEDGSCDLHYLREVSRAIGHALSIKSSYHVVAFRSTVPPGTTLDEMLPVIEKVSGKKAGKDFGICFHPEFLRESTAIHDFYNPPKTVVGVGDDHCWAIMRNLYQAIDSRVIRTTVEAAEMVKYVDNTWHALKVSFGNEVGKIAQSMGVDSHEVMNIFVQDTKLNISPYYLKPGFAFGGSCLPKDVRGMTHLAHENGIETPVINSIISSNDAQIEHAIKIIKNTGKRSIGFLGITFKAGTDDLRESPVLPVMAALLEEGFELSFYDPNLDIQSSVRHHLQHAKADGDTTSQVTSQLQNMACESFEELQDRCEVLVATQKDDALLTPVVERRADQHLVDLVRLFSPEGEVSKIDACGMDGFLQKPSTAEAIIEKLQAIAGLSTKLPHEILLAEDNPTIRLVIKIALEKIGWSVTTAENGREAYIAATEREFDAILMDLRMPIMDGYQATRAIRDTDGIYGFVPIIALTAHAAPETASTYNGICW